MSKSNKDFRQLISQDTTAVDAGPVSTVPTEDSEKGDERRGETAKDKRKKFWKKKQALRKEAEDARLSATQYRDRAKERREGRLPSDSGAFSTGPAVPAAPPTSGVTAGTGGTFTAAHGNTSLSHREGIEQSKFLGGDVEHTHLVKGLDYALLAKVRSEMGKDEDTELEQELHRAVASAEAQAHSTNKEHGDSTGIEGRATFKTVLGKSVYQYILPPKRPGKLEAFLPERTTYVYDFDVPAGRAHPTLLPTTVLRGADDITPTLAEPSLSAAPPPDLHATMVKLMTFMRSASTGDVAEGKGLKKQRSLGNSTGSVVASGASTNASRGDQEMKDTGTGDTVATSGPPVPPLPPQRQAPPRPKPAPIDDDIFGDAGEYTLEVPATTGPPTGPSAGPPASGPSAGPPAGPSAGPPAGPSAGPPAGPSAGPSAGPAMGPSDGDYEMYPEVDDYIPAADTSARPPTLPLPPSPPRTGMMGSALRHRAPVRPDVDTVDSEVYDGYSAGLATGALSSGHYTEIYEEGEEEEDDAAALRRHRAALSQFASQDKDAGKGGKGLQGKKKQAHKLNSQYQHIMNKYNSKDGKRGLDHVEARSTGAGGSQPKKAKYTDD